MGFKNILEKIDTLVRRPQQNQANADAARAWLRGINPTMDQPFRSTSATPAPFTQANLPEKLEPLYRDSDEAEPDIDNTKWAETVGNQSKDSDLSR